MRVLKLNASYEFLGIERWQDVIGDILDKKSRIEVAYPDEYLRSPSIRVPRPAVIIMNYYVKTKKRAKMFAANTRNVIIRDNFTCQYCGCRISFKTGTKDHVIPFSRGGPTKMSNLVAACKVCNSLKDDRTCEESNMYPMNKPRPMTEEEKLRSIIKSFGNTERKVWYKYLKENKIKLW